MCRSRRRKTFSWLTFGNEIINFKLLLKKQGYPSLKKYLWIFINKEDAQRRAREKESKLDKGIFEDLTAAKNILLKDLSNL
jgi:hypothetical protein